MSYNDIKNHKYLQKVLKVEKEYFEHKHAFKDIKIECLEDLVKLIDNIESESKITILLSYNFINSAIL